MTIHTLPPRPSFRLVERTGGIADVVKLPERPTVGEVAAAAVDQVEAAQNKEREGLQNLQRIRFELSVLAERALFVAKFYKLHSPVESLFRGTVDQMSKELR